MDYKHNFSLYFEPSVETLVAKKLRFLIYDMFFVSAIGSSKSSLNHAILMEYDQGSSDSFMPFVARLSRFIRDDPSSFCHGKYIGY